MIALPLSLYTTPVPPMRQIMVCQQLSNGGCIYSAEVHFRKPLLLWYVTHVYVLCLDPKPFGRGYYLESHGTPFQSSDEMDVLEGLAEAIRKDPRVIKETRQPIY